MKNSESLPYPYLCALNAVVQGDSFEAYFHLQSLDRSFRELWPVERDVFDLLDTAARKLCLQTPLQANLLLDLLALMPGGVSRVSPECEDLIIKNLLHHELDEEGASLLAAFANNLIEDHIRLKADLRLSLVALISLSFGQPPAEGCGVQIERFGFFLSRNARGDFLTSLSWILMPIVVLVEEGKLDEEAVELIERRLTGPLFSICERLADQPGMVKPSKYFETLQWFATTRLEDIPPICQLISFYQPSKIALLIARMWQCSVRSYQDQIKGLDSQEREIRLHACSVTLDYVMTHLDAAQADVGMTHLFAGLLAQYGHLLHYGGHTSFELLIKLLNSIFSHVDLEQCQELLKRRNGIYLSLYLRDFSPKSLNVLPESMITELFEHDLGL
jgi:hypothetical protein